MKRLPVLALAFLLPATCFASTQLFMGGSNGPINATTDLPIDRAGSALNSIASRTGLMGVAGTFSNLRVWVDTDPGAGNSWVVSFRKNGGATTETCTISTGNTSCTDTTHTDSVAAGDRPAIRATISGTPAAANVYESITFTPTTPNELTVPIETNINYSQTLEGFSAVGAVGITANTGPESLAAGIFSEAGTLDNMRLSVNTAPGGTASVTYTLKQNFGTSTPTCQMVGATTSCTDLSNVVSVAQSDLLALAAMPAGTPALAQQGGGFRFVPTTPKVFMFWGGTVAAFTTQTIFVTVSGGIGITNVTAASSTLYASPMTITAVSLAVGTANGAAVTRTATLVKNGVDTSLICTIGNSASKNRCTGSVAVAAGDQLYWRVNTTGAGGSTRIFITTSATTGGLDAWWTFFLSLFF